MIERIVGINDWKFIIHQNMLLNRKNFIYKSEQFQKIMCDFLKSNSKLNNFELDSKIYELFEMNKSKLTDIEIIFDGNY